MEDALEDAQASAEREESIMQERMKRLKEKEDAMKKELNDGRKETEQILKSEAKAKSRIEEIEEALRESTVALENARAEVENLRSELAVRFQDYPCKGLANAKTESRRTGGESFRWRLVLARG